MESPRIAAEEAWESEVAPESEMAPASEAALEPAESEVAPALPESEMAPEPEERPSMLSRLASWRAPEPEQETAQTEEVHPVAGGEGNGVQSRVRIRLLECLEKSEVIGRVTALPDPGRYDCRAPPGRLGLAFKDATCVVGRVNATSALFGTVRKGDELVSVNGGSVTADDVLGVLAAQDDGTTDRTLAFARASGRRPEDYYACYAPPGDLCIAFESDARRLVGALSKGNGYEPGFVVGRVDPTSALRGVVAEGDALVTVNEVPCCGRDVGPWLALPQPSSAAFPPRRLVFARKGFRLAPKWDLHKICCLLCCSDGEGNCICCPHANEDWKRKNNPGGYKQQSIIYYDVSWISGADGF